MRFPYRRIAIPIAALATTLLLGSIVTGCAPAVDHNWKPPLPSAVDGITVAAGMRPFAPTVSPAALPEDVLAPSGDPAQLGLTQGRIRNDDLQLQARYLYVPGQQAFNDHVRELLWSTIRSTGKAYAPQAFAVGAGMGARGCVNGSTERSPSEILSDPTTGPAGGSGTAITCSFLGAAGPYIGARFRIVSGAPAQSGDATQPATITADRTETWFVNVQTGEILDSGNRWRPEAGAELWLATVAQLRERLGTLSTAPIADPSPEQAALAAAALNTAVATIDGVALTLPPGIAAPELAALGVAETSGDTSVSVTNEVLREWASDAERARIDSAAQPFAGLATGAAAPPTDCTLVPCVAVTYDDGPSEHTQRLLDTLSAKHVPATFFMLGSKAGGAPDLVRKVLAQGNEIGSHSMSHPDLTKLPIPAAIAQVRDAAATLTNITGKPVTFYRPPFGAINDKLLRAIGMPAVLWSVDTNDWQDPGQDALVERSVPTLKPGGIVLFHDTHPDSVDVAGRVIDGLEDRGFSLVTVSQLFGGQVPGGKVFAR